MYKVDKTQKCYSRETVAKCSFRRNNKKLWKDKFFVNYRERRSYLEPICNRLRCQMNMSVKNKNAPRLKYLGCTFLEFTQWQRAQYQRAWQTITSKTITWCWSIISILQTQSMFVDVSIEATTSHSPGKKTLRRTRRLSTTCNLSVCSPLLRVFCSTLMGRSDTQWARRAPQPLVSVPEDTRSWQVPFLEPVRKFTPSELGEVLALWWGIEWGLECILDIPVQHQTVFLYQPTTGRFEET